MYIIYIYTRIRMFMYIFNYDRQLWAAQINNAEKTRNTKLVLRVISKPGVLAEHNQQK